ncbi:MAG TPA: hypothetical protein VNJ04_11765 [Gemmatimonadaceae bacterium]|nr:hypothetical protein [Gemmatimonadaceae bacterium]
MTTIQDALDALVAVLLGAGIAAGCDPAKLNPPCAWVHADQFTIDNLDGSGTLGAFVDLAVPAWAYPQAMAALTDLLGRALSVITPDGPVELDRAIDLTGGKTLPAFRIPLDLDL